MASEANYQISDTAFKMIRDIINKDVQQWNKRREHSALKEQETKIKAMIIKEKQIRKAGDLRLKTLKNLLKKVEQEQECSPPELECFEGSVPNPNKRKLQSNCPESQPSTKKRKINTKPEQE